MLDRTEARVESWDARPFSGGFATLRDAADASFSGVVVAGDAWLFMLNGRVVGIVDGDIDDFEDASGTMYEAPDPALPLLFSMRERGGTTQAKYYTNDTPLTEADRTLSDANFTGYVELSENVLSGDYYLVYYGGRALPVAFVGASEELKTGEAAFDLAADEVGVYEVIKAPVNVTQVPRPSDSDAASAAGTAAGVAADEPVETAAAHGDAGDETVETADERGEAGDERVEAAEGAAEATDAEDAPIESAEAESGDTTDSVDAADAVDASTSADAESPPAEDAGATDDASMRESTATDDRSPVGEAESRVEAAAVGTAASTAEPSSSDVEPTTNGGADHASDDRQAAQRSVFSEEEQWRKTKSIPSLTPNEREKRRQAQESETTTPTRDERASTSTPGAETSSPDSDAPTQEHQRSPSPARGRESTATSDRQQANEPSEVESATSSPQSATTAVDSEARSSTGDAATESATSERAGDEPSSETSAHIAGLESQVETLESERDDLATDLASVREERDELQRRVHQLEDALEAAGGEPTPGPTLTPDEALEGTNLFVRYGSKGQPTLDDLAGKNPDREAIDKNLRIDHHTQFDAQEASVDGVPFTEFLSSSSAYRFVSWLVRELPYEVLDSGHRSGMGDLYDAVPEVDRAELQGVVEVETEDGPERRSFDVVLRDRMGNPLVVAELNDERDPVTGDEMASLVEAATVVGEGTDDLGAAFYVTASFFEPNALENAADATASGGILSRGDRDSYVRLARKRGFHLCLTEDRNDAFHLTVPEL